MDLIYESMGTPTSLAMNVFGSLKAFNIFSNMVKGLNRLFQNPTKHGLVVHYV